MDPQAPLYMYPQGVARSVGVGGGTTGDSIIQVAKDFSGYASPGAAGTVLKSNGVGVAPSFQANTPSTFQVFTSGSGTYTSPAGCQYIIVEMVGGGGGGSKNALANAGSGGGGGGYLKVRFAPGSYSYAVGAQGAGATVATNAGTNGGDTTFSTLVASGGVGGPTTTTSIAAGGGTTTTGALQVLLSIAGQRSSTGAIAVSPGGSSIWGMGGTGVFVGGSASDPVDGRGYGGGGSGVTSVNYAGAAGNGSAGRIVVEEFY